MTRHPTQAQAGRVYFILMALCGGRGHGISPVPTLYQPRGVPSDEPPSQQIFPAVLDLREAVFIHDSPMLQNHITPAPPAARPWHQIPNPNYAEEPRNPLPSTNRRFCV